MGREVLETRARYFMCYNDEKTEKAGFYLNESNENALQSMMRRYRLYKNIKS